MDALPALSLVIPAFNEERVIDRAVREAEAALASLFPDFEIILVDDGSTDSTAAAAERLAGGSPGLRVLRHETNRGYGAALRTGFEAARFPLVAFTDADCQFDLADLGPLAAATADYPIAVGYRVNRQDPFRRRVLSRGYNLLARLLLGTRVRDCDCALKVFRRGALADLMPQSRGFFANTEMLTRAWQKGYPVIELPVRHRPRAAGRSKVSMTEVPRTLRVLLPFWWREVVLGPRPEPAVVLTARVRAGLAARRPAAGPPPAFAPSHPAERPEGRRESA